MIGDSLKGKYEKQLEDIKKMKIFQEIRQKKDLKSDGSCHICKKPAKGGKDFGPNWYR